MKNYQDLKILFAVKIAKQAFLMIFSKIIRNFFLEKQSFAGNFFLRKFSDFKIFIRVKIPLRRKYPKPKPRPPVGRPCCSLRSQMGLALSPHCPARWAGQGLGACFLFLALLGNGLCYCAARFARKRKCE